MVPWLSERYIHMMYNDIYIYILMCWDFILYVNKHGQMINDINAWFFSFLTWMLHVLNLRDSHTEEDLTRVHWSSIPRQLGQRRFYPRLTLWHEKKKARGGDGINGWYMMLLVKWSRIFIPGGGILLCSPLLGEDSQFDLYFYNGLTPPISIQ